MLRRFAKRSLWVFLTVVAIVAWIVLLDVFATVTKPNVYQLWGNEGYVWLFYRLWWLAPTVIALVAAVKGLRWELGPAVLSGFGLAWYSLFTSRIVMLRLGAYGIAVPGCITNVDLLSAALLAAMPALAGWVGWRTRGCGPLLRSLAATFGGRSLVSAPTYDTLRR